MNGNQLSWIDLWLRRLMRYGVGGGGIVWAIATDHLNPVVWMVLGAIATSTDIFMVARGLVQAAKEEGRWIEQERERTRHRQETQRPQSPPGSHDA